MSNESTMKAGETMSLVLNDWNKDWSLMDVFFDPEEIKEIETRLKEMEPENIVFCSFESRFAKSGGLGTVASKMLPHFKTIDPVKRVLLLTPFYPHIMDEKKLAPAGVEPFDVVYDGKPVQVELLKFVDTTTITLNNDNDEPHEETVEVEEFYLKAAGYFTAENPINDPYGYFPDDAERNDTAILENALFYSAAVPQATKALGLRENIVFHLQEWQTALVSLTAKKAMLQPDGLTSCGCVQTIHNPFDAGVSIKKLVKLTGDQQIMKNELFIKEGGSSVYRIGLQLVDAPITTVSRNFARELTTDLLQTDHFAPHLQDIFDAHGVFGINNGLFIDFPKEYAEEREYTLDELKKRKENKRNALLKILAEYQPKERFGQLTYQGNTIEKLPPHVPILVMSGRLDPLQKGFDILLRALERFQEDEIKVVLTPMAVRPSDLDYFYEVALKCKGNVTVFPMRMEKGYSELQMGATFGMMPSIYEPFGAAIEYMVSGTVTIARKTGGLKDQIIHRRCGLLYREELEDYTPKNIKTFSESNDIVQLRKRNAWAQSMADKLYRVIKDAQERYGKTPENYYKCIQTGLKTARKFTWHKAALQYVNIYQKIKCF